MTNHTSSAPQGAITVRQTFYDLAGRSPDSEAAWAERQDTLRTWRGDPRVEADWPTIDHMLADDFASFRRRNATMQQARESAGDLEGYDFEACRQQREYDLKHARDHLP